MADTQIMTKRMAINKANAQMVIIVGVAAFVTVFCLVAAKAVWSQNSYQARVTTAKETANKQLKSNISAYDNLTTSYESFVSTPNNVIGGLSNGNGSNDGDNAKVVLDALPPSYDFPALTSTLEKILDNGNFKASSITGTDDQLNQENNTSSSDPQPVSMPFTFSVSNTSYGSVGQLINTLQHSIRPIQIDTLDLSGGSSQMTVSVTAHTYYQPSKSLSITTKVVK
jgi:uncharacterized protein YpmS